MCKLITIPAGTRFGRLTVIDRCGHLGPEVAWKCACDCGSVHVVRSSHLRTGRVMSCGCKRYVETHSTRTHGEGYRRTKEYNIWNQILQRCNNQTNKSYRRYGGRGITVCERWLKYDLFLADMGRKPYGRSLDRIDNDGNYEPTNCRWSTQVEQQNNKTTNRNITWGGKTKTISQWARDLHVDPSLIRDRLELGWPVHLALSMGHRKRGARQAYFGDR